MPSCESPDKQFNTTVTGFVADLKKIFGASDPEISAIEMACDMTHMNVRLILTPFQTYISGNPDFVKNIMGMNVDYFLAYDYEGALKVHDNEGDYNNKLINKFRDATRMHRDDTHTIASIFNWFKVMMYHSYLDQGLDPTKEMAVVGATSPPALSSSPQQQQ
jgi:hypothetical protein